MERQSLALGQKTDRSGRGLLVALLLGYLALLAAGWWGLGRMLPAHLSFHVLGKTLELKSLYNRIAGDAALVFLILPGALWIETVVVGWRNSSARQMLLHPTASTKTDLAFFVLSQAHLMGIVGRLMTLGATMLSGAAIHDWLSASLGVSISLAGLPLLLQIVIYFYVATFFDYWTHRLDHSTLFWPLHRYHHAAEDFCVITAARSHPAAFTAIFFITLPMAVLGASPVVMVTVNVMVIALGFLIHSKIDSNFGWVGRYIIQSPQHHRLHHQLDYVTIPTGHFGMAPVWDHLFGTWRGECDQTLVIGVDTPYRHGVWLAPDLIRDYADFWKGWAQAPALLLGRLPRRSTAGAA